MQAVLYVHPPNISDPVDMDEGDTNRKQSEHSRLAILSYIETTMRPIRVDDLKVAKTDALKQQYKEKIIEIDGEDSWVQCPSATS